MNLINNIVENYVFLQEDFTGISLSFRGLSNYFIEVLITIIFFFVAYNLGSKIIRKNFHLDNELRFFINVALGVIIIGTGIGILGLFSLLYPQTFTIYLLLLCCLACFPCPKLNLSLKVLKKQIRLFFANHNQWVIIGVLLFVGISFLRLSIPDTTEDGYHTDLPRFYLQTHTTLHETKDLLHVIPYPQLAEMIYVIPIFLGYKDTVRFIHFGFYILVIFFLFRIAKKKEYKYAEYAPLLFASAPIVIKYAASQYTDFFMLLFFLLSVFLIKKNSSIKQTYMSGIFYGAVLAIKMWMLIYMPIFLLYSYILNRKQHFSRRIILVTVFFLGAIAVPMLWYIRSFLITGNPIYPIFTRLEHFDKLEPTMTPSVSSYFGFNSLMFSIPTLIVFSPLFFIGILFMVFNAKKFLSIIKNSPIFVFVLLLLLEQLFVRVYLGRYLVAWYTITAVIVSASIMIGLSKSKILQYVFTVLCGIIFFYYFTNTLLTLPYGLGWADTNKYLTRILFRDNASYYDFNHLFDKHIAENDFVATYAVVNYYYANFKYSDIGYIFKEHDRSFNDLRKHKVSKLLIKGGDVEWFCKRLMLKNCTKDRVKLLALYPSDVPKFYLYSLEK